MRPLLQLLAAAVLFTLVSCQKEISLETGTTNTGGTGGTGGGGSGSGTLLFKIVSKQLGDSIVETYSYNSANKLITNDIKGKAGGIEMDQKNTYTRDAQNRITRIREIQVIPTIPGFPMGGTIDTTYTDYYYSGTDTKVSYSKRLSQQMGITYQDSTVFTYTGNNVTKTKNYILVPGTGYDEVEETVYTYDANNNITNVKVYDLSSGTPDLMTERKYIYDSKVSPLILGHESVITFMEELSGSNNATSIQIIDYVSGSGNTTTTTTFTYRSNNTPASANVSVAQAGGSFAGTAAYYYQ